MTNNIIIVKTSSLGDIIQTFPVLDELKSYFPDCNIDWVVKKNYKNFLKSHPLINSVIAYDDHNIFQAFKKLRKKRYDFLIDLQGNTKSAIVTFFLIAKIKIGFGKKSVREFPNLLVTTHKYNISKQLNIQDYYLELVRKHFKIYKTVKKSPLNLTVDFNKLNKIIGLVKEGEFKIMVAMGSNWKNKELDHNTLVRFLTKVQKHLNANFYFVYGTLKEKETCKFFQKELGQKCSILEKMEIQIWQNIMAKMNLILTVDTAALHLGATANTITFSIFGPTSAKIFQPTGNHFSLQGKCPYNVQFVKQCPYLRKCPTGACIKKISVETLWNKFQPCLRALISANTNLKK